MVTLCILDGFGIKKDELGNAVIAAGTPKLDELKNNYPFAEIEASGEAVGLPEGQMGNSEVGHTNLGAGRVVMQDLPKIDLAIENGTIKENKILECGEKATVFYDTICKAK